MAKNGYKMIDAELHVMEPVDLWDNYIADEFKDRAPKRLQEGQWDLRTMVEGVMMATMPEAGPHSEPGRIKPDGRFKSEDEVLGIRYKDDIARNFDPESLVLAMKKEGLDLAVLFPTSGMFVTAKNGMDPRFAAAACEAYNNWLYDYMEAGDSSITFGAGIVSPHDVESAVIETRRCAKHLGFNAIMLRPNMYNNTPWHNKYYDPLWKECEELGIAATFHETTGHRLPALGQDRFPSQVGIAHVASHSGEQMMACLDIIMGGVMERFPKLQFAFLEGQCGWLPFWLGRMDEHYEWREPYGEMDHLKMEPSEYFRRQGYVAVEADEEFVSHVVDAFGDDNLLTTTDYPHADSKFPHATDTFLGLPMPDSSKKKILWDNPVRLYSL
jgi:predicted TIM-barrel fold metal-dependent hydrolase